jgi:hypothetical protein
VGQTDSFAYKTMFILVNMMVSMFSIQVSRHNDPAPHNSSSAFSPCEKKEDAGKFGAR